MQQLQTTQFLPKLLFYDENVHHFLTKKGHEFELEPQTGKHTQ